MTTKKKPQEDDMKTNNVRILRLITRAEILDLTNTKKQKSKKARDAKILPAKSVREKS